jgi:hypothetical protein
MFASPSGRSHGAAIAAGFLELLVIEDRFEKDAKGVLQAHHCEVHREPAEDHDPTPPAGSARSLSQGSMVCLAPSMDAKLC